MSDGINYIPSINNYVKDYTDIKNITETKNGVKNYTLVNDGEGKYLFITNNNIEIPGASFKDILGAKVINDSGQNFIKCAMSDKVPESQKHGIYLMR